MDYITYLIIYLGICWVFFKYPWLLHKKLPEIPKLSNLSKIWIISHRGGSGEKPENTLDAFRHSKYADALELDIVCSLDQQLVISHEDHLLRLTGQDLCVSSLNYEDLPNYSPTFNSHFLDHPVICDKIYSFITLEKLFRELPGIYINIDLKICNEFTIGETRRLVNEYSRADTTVIIK